MEIRFYKDADFTAAVKIFVELSAYYLGALCSSEAEVKENLRSNVLGPDSGVKLVLAFENGAAIGLAAVSLLYPAPNETGQLFVKELFVKAQYQDGGVGKSIMGFIARYAQIKKCSRLDLAVDSDNTKAIRFYQRLGVLPLATKLYFRAEVDAINSLAKNV